jgi:hypothetical protein
VTRGRLQTTTPEAHPIGRRRQACMATSERFAFDRASVATPGTINDEEDLNEG